MEYYSSVLKRKETLTRATAWMNLEDKMLSELCRSQKDRKWFHLQEGLKVVKLTETETRWWGPGAGVGKKGS